MDILKQLNNTVIYIEDNLCGEIDIYKIAEIALCPYDKFKRFFSYMTNMSVSEYIRKRRLTLAAYELLNVRTKIIDLAVKYGYNSADSFTMAFAKQHEVLPTEVSADTPLKIYPLVSFYVAIKGADELNFRIVNIDELKLKGISRQFTGLAAAALSRNILCGLIGTMMFKIKSALPLNVADTVYGITEFIQ